MFPQIDYPTNEVFFRKENVDLRSFPYVITYTPEGFHVSEIARWLGTNVGDRTIKWTYVVYRIQNRNKRSFIYDWRFKNKEDLVLFKLRWL